MTIHLEASPCRSANLTPSQLQTVRQVWDFAGLPPTSGYATAFLAAAGATDITVRTALTSVDLDNADSVADAVAVLLQWRLRTSHLTA
jgi:hypothetical protein